MGACWAHNPEVDGSKPSSAIFYYHCYFFITSMLCFILGIYILGNDVEEWVREGVVEVEG